MGSEEDKVMEVGPLWISRRGQELSRSCFRLNLLVWR